MAKALAVRSIVTNANGSITIGFAGGSPTAQPGQSGTAELANEAAVIDFIREFEANLTDLQLLALHLAITYLKNDGTFNNVNQVTNKELRFDVFAAQPVRIV